MAIRVTQIGLEVWVQNPSTERVTQAGIEVWVNDPSKIRVTQAGLELWRTTALTPASISESTAAVDVISASINKVVSLIESMTATDAFGANANYNAALAEVLPTSDIYNYLGRIYSCDLQDLVIITEQWGNIGELTGQGNYFFKFPTEYLARTDPIVGPYLRGPKNLTPCYVYDITASDVTTVGEWWCLIVDGPPANPALANHPNLQFLLNRTVQFTQSYILGAGTAIIINNLEPPSLIKRLSIIFPESPYGPTGIH